MTEQELLDDWRAIRDRKERAMSENDLIRHVAAAMWKAEAVVDPGPRNGEGGMTDLDKLIEAVEAGRDDSEKWRPAMGGNQYLAFKAMESFHGSIDAAEALHDALLPGWGYNVKHLTHGKPRAFVARHPFSADYVEAETPARAWLLAILRAYRTQVQP